ncbi:unnamed protein product [Phytomonas sp. Hart1]|nr:unnamed protein product [Phytomonas sp. Hart1]|eukprot:CCW71187.1 unnamed protein product [Phytomonas sp. isolate Hart1]
MAQNLFVAEGIDILRQSDAEERELDKSRLRIKGGKGSGEQLLSIVQRYQNLYHRCVQGMEILNHVRHTALSEAATQNDQYSRKISNFCTQKIVDGVKQCKRITKMLDSISFPLDHADLIRYEGYLVENSIFHHDGKRFPLKGKEKMLSQEFNLTDGTYNVLIKNLDDYTIARPEVSVVFALIPHGEDPAESSKMEFMLFCGCAWVKTFGVFTNNKYPTSLQLQVRSSGMRESHIEVHLQKWKPVECDLSANAGEGNYGKPASIGENAHYFDNLGNLPLKERNEAADGEKKLGSNWMDGIPTLGDSELETLAAFNVPHSELPNRDNDVKDLTGSPASAALSFPKSNDGKNPWVALESLNVPHTGDHGRTEFASVPAPVEYRPKGLNCRQRMQILRAMLNAWPSEGNVMLGLQTNSQQILNSVYALPLPTEIE